MSTEVEVNELLVSWGERWDWSPQNRKPQAAKHTRTGLAKAVFGRKRAPMTAEVARHNLQAFLRKTPQVLVKISGGGKGMSKVMPHLTYISRNGELPLEDERGDVIEGREDVLEMRRQWGQGGFPMPEESETREALNIVLSMPEGTDELAVFRAAREFARREFGGNHQYVFALHTFVTDPGPRPSKHPHVHLAVKMRGFDGIKLNPRKADLQDWREGFAQALRENGVEAVATRRRGRLVREKGQTQSIRQIAKRGLTPKHVLTAVPQRKASQRAEENVKAAWKDFRAIASALAKSVADDRQMALNLIERLRELNGRRIMRNQDRKDKRPPSERSGPSSGIKRG